MQAQTGLAASSLLADILLDLSYTVNHKGSQIAFIWISTLARIFMKTLTQILKSGHTTAFSGVLLY